MMKLCKLSDIKLILELSTFQLFQQYTFPTKAEPWKRSSFSPPPWNKSSISPPSAWNKSSLSPAPFPGKVPAFPPNKLMLYFHIPSASGRENMNVTR